MKSTKDLGFEFVSFDSCCTSLPLPHQPSGGLPSAPSQRQFFCSILGHRVKELHSSSNHEQSSERDWDTAGLLEGLPLGTLYRVGKLQASPAFHPLTASNVGCSKPIARRMKESAFFHELSTLPALPLCLITRNPFETQSLHLQLLNHVDCQD